MPPIVISARAAPLEGGRLPMNEILIALRVAALAAGSAAAIAKLAELVGAGALEVRRRGVDDACVSP